MNYLSWILHYNQHLHRQEENKGQFDLLEQQDLFSWADERVISLESYLDCQ